MGRGCWGVIRGSLVCGVRRGGGRRLPRRGEGSGDHRLGSGGVPPRGRFRCQTTPLVLTVQALPGPGLSTFSAERDGAGFPKGPSHDPELGGGVQLYSVVLESDSSVYWRRTVTVGPDRNPVPSGRPGGRCDGGKSLSFTSTPRRLVGLVSGQ